MILYNGILYTGNAEKPLAEAIALRGDRIVGIGTSTSIRSTFESENSIDLQGAACFPGFTDSHAHMQGLGLQLLNLNLVGTGSVGEIQNLVREYAKSLPSGSWLSGGSWDQNNWPVQAFPTHQMLDEVAGDHPVTLRRVDGHALWVNAKVLSLAKVTRTTPDPPGGKIIRNGRGEPTGVFVDNAMDLIDAVIPPILRQQRSVAIQKAIAECARFGLTEVHDMGADLETIGIYKELIAEKKFPFRVYAAIGGLGETWRHYQLHTPEIDSSGRLAVRALKLYADGALGSRGALLLAPYSDDPKNSGLEVTPIDSIKIAAAIALEHGYQVCVHAIGDRANREVLDAFEAVFTSNKKQAVDARFRIEHAQVISQSDIPRFAKLGVLPMMQQTHCTSDMYWAEKRVGPDRIKGAYAWRSLIQSGSIIPGGSDFPVESANPLLGFYAAITRQDKNGWPAGGWYPEQRMTRDEALKSFTLWPAYAAFEETERGTLEVGKRADLVVLSNDIMKCDPKEILDTKVNYTIIAGDIVYSAAKETTLH